MIGFIIIIPARFNSSRFPGKLLADVHGKPVIVRVVENSLTSRVKKVIIATDNVLIQQAIETEFYQYIIDGKISICFTRSTHRSGTERVAEVVNHYQFKKDQVIVHLQGDEPLVSSYMIHQCVQSLYLDTSISIATLATPIRSLQEVLDSNIVKVVINVNNNALYFSRSVIPWIKEYNDVQFGIENMLLQHIGIYSYRVNFLHRYVEWIPSPLEQYEMLEQLRVLWNGEIIRVSVINNAWNVSVDTPESLERVNKLFLKNKLIT